jgi:hypothetical protein
MPCFLLKPELEERYTKAFHAFSGTLETDTTIGGSESRRI